MSELFSCFSHFSRPSFHIPMRIWLLTPCFVSSSVLKPDDVHLPTAAKSDHRPIPITDAEAIAQYMSDEFATTDRSGMPRVPPSETAWMDRTEIVPRYVFQEMRIPLGERIGWNTVTTVFGLVTHPEWVIKYHQFCDTDSTGGVNTNLREAYFLDLIGSHCPEVTTQLLYLSGGWTPSEASPVKTPKMTSIICSDSDFPVEVRYLIIERVGQDLFTYIWHNGRISFTTAIKYGIQIFEMLQEVHALNVIHGDIHAGNVAFRSDNSGKLVLIDFGRAAIRPEVDMTDPSNKEVFCDGRFSMWEAVGGHTYVPTMRDDIYRAALLVAYMMYGRTHQTAQDDQCKAIGGTKKYLELKQKKNFFHCASIVMSSGESTVHNFLLDQILSVFRNKYEKDIASEFALMLGYIRSLEFATQVDHGIIINYLKNIQDMHA